MGLHSRSNNHWLRNLLYPLVVADFIKSSSSITPVGSLVQDSTTPAYRTYRSRMLRVQCVGFVAAVLPYDTRLYGNNGKNTFIDLGILHSKKSEFTD